MDKKQRFSQTNWDSGDTPCVLFWDRTQESSLTSSTIRFASMSSACSVSPVQSSHCASLSTGVSRKRFSISYVHSATSTPIQILSPKHSGRDDLTSSRNMAECDRRYMLCTFSPFSACLLFIPNLLL